MFALLLAGCTDNQPAATAPSAGPAVAATPAAPVSPLPGSPDYVGSAACGRCHDAEWQAWQGSHHDLAMQPPGPETVLGDFDDAHFRYGDIPTRFHRHGDDYLITTDGPDGAQATYAVRYVFGHFPLQQYLLELPGGRLQAFGIAWDSRPDHDGGQRWIHLYPDQALRAGHPLHWTGRDQNWNFMCAECHSTGLVKGYDVERDEYRTHWAEIDVGCEACHGPGLTHAHAMSDPARTGDNTGYGLTINFDERRDAHWILVSGTGSAVRSKPRDTRKEIDACGRCHGRATRLLGDAVHGGSLLDSHRPSLLDPDQYFADGQMLGEVFNWGPFLQSRMQKAGVTCSDCHEPHSLQLRAPGNALCAQCHQPERFDVPTHTHHAQDSAGSACVACHMPTTTFMRVDDRHDHAFRIPRPDLASNLGTPDACSQCHQDRDAGWAADHLRNWFADSRHRGAHHAQALHAAARGITSAAPSLARIAADRAQAPIVRASAVRALAPMLSSTHLSVVQAQLREPDPLQRLAAVEALAPLEPAQRVTTLATLLDDPVRAVRMETAAALAGPSESLLNVAQREAFTRALSEYLESLRFNADRPDALVSLADLHLRRGHRIEAMQTYRRAIERHPDFLTAWLHLADGERLAGGESRAEATLREGLQHLPEAASLHHALGLSLVRQQRRDEAEQALHRAVELEPDNVRNRHVLAVALHDWGKPDQAREHLTRALEHHPDDRDVLGTLAVYELQAGHRRAARILTQRLLGLDPDNASARELQRWLDR